LAHNFALGGVAPKAHNGRQPGIFAEGEALAVYRLASTIVGFRFNGEKPQMRRADYRSMEDDEREIGKGHRNGTIETWILIALAWGAYHFAAQQYDKQTAELVAAFVGLAAILWSLGRIINYLHDLSVRLSRTNELLVDDHDERRWPRGAAKEELKSMR
jgi:hypothetical protein